MRPLDRENKLYKEGKRVQISYEETIISNMISSAETKGSKLLDIGCGSGEIGKHYSDLGFQVVGVDFSDVAIDLSKKLGLNAMVMDVDKGLEFDDNSFDIILAGDVMEHVFDPIYVISEINRVLKPNGSFYATIPHDVHWKVRIKTLFGYSFQEGVYKKSGQFKHHTFFSENLMRYMYENANFDISKLLYLYLNPLNGNKAHSNNKLFRILSTLMIVCAINKKTQK